MMPGSSGSATKSTGIGPPVTSRHALPTFAGSATATVRPSSAAGDAARLPVRAAPAPALGRPGLAEGDDRPADRGGVEVHLGDVLELDVEHFADPERSGAFARRRQVVDLQHRHVAAVAAAALELPAGGRAVGDRGDELEEGVADREDGVAEAEVADRRIAEGLAERQLRPQSINRRVEVRHGDHGLAEARHRSSIASHCAEGDGSSRSCSGSPAERSVDRDRGPARGSLPRLTEPDSSFVQRPFALRYLENSTEEGEVPNVFERRRLRAQGPAPGDVGFRRLSLNGRDVPAAAGTDVGQSLRHRTGNERPRRRGRHGQCVDPGG